MTNEVYSKVCSNSGSADVLLLVFVITATRIQSHIEFKTRTRWMGEE